MLGLENICTNNFIRFVKKNKRDTIRACTSPANKGSIEFHKKIGFQIEHGNAEFDGTPVTLDYNQPNDPKVLFKKKI